MKETYLFVLTCRQMGFLSGLLCNVPKTRNVLFHYLFQAFRNSFGIYLHFLAEWGMLVARLKRKKNICISS